MSFTQAIQSGFQNYANFEGRSGRSAYWYWALFAFLLGFIPSVLGILPLQLLISLALLLPGLAVGARRLHDINRSGWNLPSRRHRAPREGAGREYVRVGLAEARRGLDG